MEYIYDILEAIQDKVNKDSDGNYDYLYHLELLGDIRDNIYDQDTINIIQKEIDYICSECCRCPTCFGKLYPTHIDENNPTNLTVISNNNEQCNYICECCGKMFDNSFVKPDYNEPVYHDYLM